MGLSASDSDSAVSRGCQIPSTSAARAVDAVGIARPSASAPGVARVGRDAAATLVIPQTSSIVVRFSNKGSHMPKGDGK